MQRAISASMRVATSCMIPLPIWATRPVTSMSLETLTRLPAGSGSTAIVIVAWAVPWPRASLPLARITAVRAASSCSAIATLPA